MKRLCSNTIFLTGIVAMATLGVIADGWRDWLRGMPFYLPSSPRQRASFSLPREFERGTSSASWQVSPATRNLRVSLTPFYYEPAYGPPVNVTLNYVRERKTCGTLGWQWAMNYDSYVNIVGNELRVLRPNGVCVTYDYDYTTNAYAYPENSSDRLYVTPLSLVIIRQDNSYEEYSLLHFRLNALGDAQGHELRFIRDQAGGLDGIVDAAGHTNTVQRYAHGRIMQITDPLGRSAVFEYNGDWLVRVISMDGTTNEFVYDAANFSIDSIATADNHYDIEPNYTSQVNEDGLQVWDRLSVYDAHGYTNIHHWEASTDYPGYYHFGVVTQMVRHMGLVVKDVGGYTYQLVSPVFQSFAPTVDTHCVRTDEDAVSSYKRKFFVGNSMVHGEDEDFAGAWRPAVRQYYSADGFLERMVHLPFG